MKVLSYLSLFCLFLPGCVSEQWVRGYVQHELAGVRDIVAEEVYPLEKALTDVRTQMATISVGLKEVANDLQTLKESVAGGGKKWQEMEQKIAGLQKDLKGLEVELGSLREDLQKLHQNLAQVQIGTETTSERQQSGPGR